MKIIVSPTKTMRRTKYDVGSSQPLFKKEAQKIRKELKTYSYEELKGILKTSDNLTKKSYQYYHEELAPIQAVNLYKGAAFKAMKLDTFDRDDFNYLNSRLVILSAMYGLLRPFDLIQEYRLDYLTKFNINLYDFWRPKLSKSLAKQDVVINLASQEFTNSFEHHHMINIHFLDNQNRNLSSQAKQARGDMVHYIIKNRINNLNDIKKYKGLNYKFNSERSDTKNYYFIKEI